MNRRRRLVLIAALSLALVAAPRAAPDEELLGKSRGYPVGTRATWFFDETVRVGSFSSLDSLLPHHVLRKAAVPWPLPRARSEPPIAYRFGGERHTLDDYLAHQRITALLVVKDCEIQAERYQYDRTDRHRFVSHSMAKSMVSLGIGFALADGRIRSLDDKAGACVPALAGNAFGETTLRNLLRMSSGVKFSENYDGKDDLARFARTRAMKGTAAGLLLFGERERAQGERFHYASIETSVLAAVLAAATGRTLSDYLAERLWQPMGAESDATWIIGGDGLERAAGNFNAVLRDYGRLGVLLANDGMRDGRQIVPREYLREATDWHRHPADFAPTSARLGYGYQFWTLAGEPRQFALLGVYGQSIFADPARKIVMVQLAAAKNARVGVESMAAERMALWRGVLASLTPAGNGREP